MFPSAGFTKAGGLLFRNTNNETNFNKMKTKSFLCSLILTAAVMVATLPAAADTVAIPADLSTVSNATLYATDGPSTPIVPYHDYGFMISQAAVNQTVSNTVYGFDLQIGTNWTTTAPLKLTLPLTGPTNTTGYFYVPQTNLVGVANIRLGYLSTTALTNVVPASIQAGVIR